MSIDEPTTLFLAVLLVRNAELEAENARLRRRGKQKDPARLKLGERIHKLRLQGLTWKEVRKQLWHLDLVVRSLQNIRRDWLASISRSIETCGSRSGP